MKIKDFQGQFLVDDGFGLPLKSSTIFNYRKTHRLTSYFFNMMTYKNNYRVILTKMCINFPETLPSERQYSCQG